MSGSLRLVVTQQTRAELDNNNTKKEEGEKLIEG